MALLLTGLFCVASVIVGSSAYLNHVRGYDAKVESGQRAGLRCYWSAQYYINIQIMNWYHQEVGTSTRVHVYRYNNGYTYQYGRLKGRSSHLISGSNSYSGNVYLYIHGANYTDDGRYTCELRGSRGYTRSAELDLTVCTGQQNLTIEASPEPSGDNITIVEGQPLSVSALADCARPQPNLTIHTLYGNPDYEAYTKCDEGLTGTLGYVRYNVYQEHSVTVESEHNCVSNTRLQRTLTISVLRGPNHFTRTPENTGILLGGTARLNCTVNRLDRELFEWLVFTKATGPVGRRIFMSASGVSDPSKYEVEGTYNLLIKNVTSSDAGRYKCRLVVANKGHNAHLTVLTPVQCEPPRDADVEKHDDVELVCSADYEGREAPLLTWSSSGVLSSRNDTDQGKARYVTIQNASQENHGREYTCDLTFPAKPHDPKPPRYTDSCGTRFFVLTPVHSLVIEPSSAPGQVLQVKVGNVFRCTAQGRPLPGYTWTRRQGNGPRVIYGSMMEVTREMADELSEYECMAENNVKGQRHRLTATVKFYANGTAQDLQDPPRHTAARMYTDALISCTVINSTGFGWLEWHFEHYHIKGSQRIFDSRNPDDWNRQKYDIEGTYDLRVKWVASSSAGTYECRIMPKGKSYSAELVVIEGQLTCGPQRDSFIEGDLLELPCGIRHHGNMAPRLSWYGEGIGPLPGRYQVIGNDVRISSNVVASQIYHQRELSCQLHFTESECDPTGGPDFNDTCSTSITVTSPVRSLVLTPDPRDFPGGILRFNSSGVVSCSASGNPAATITWRRACGTDIVEGSRLSLLNRTVTSGINIWECRAWNEIDGVEYVAQRTVNFYVKN